jgi:hypothetical protein
VTSVVCEQVQDAAPELALGLLTGRERATHLEHLEHCGACRAEVSALAVAADDVLLAAPETAPPDGFEHRVLERLAALRRGPGSEPAPARARPGRSRRWRRVLAGAAVAAAAAVAAVAGFAAGGTGDPGTVAADMRTGRGRLVGTATVTVGGTAGGTAESGDGPVTVSVRLPGWPELIERYGTPGGDHWLAVELDDGSRTLDRMPPSATRWDVPLRAAAGDVAAVSVLDGDGRAWCTARFPA